MGYKRRGAVVEKPVYELREYRLIYQDGEGKELHTRGATPESVLRTINALSNNIETRLKIRGKSEWIKL